MIILAVGSTIDPLHARTLTQRRKKNYDCQKEGGVGGGVFERNSWTKQGWEPGNRKCGSRKWGEEGSRRWRDRKMWGTEQMLCFCFCPLVRSCTIFPPFCKSTGRPFLLSTLTLVRVLTPTTTAHDIILNSTYISLRHGPRLLKFVWKWAN